VGLLSCRMCCAALGWEMVAEAIPGRQVFQLRGAVVLPEETNR